MNRRDFFNSLAAIPVASLSMKIKALNQLADLPDEDGIMPVLFVGHGSPMNAIEDNDFVKGWKETSNSLPLPKAILCISAHWQTNGAWLTAMDTPQTIHDFWGFPDALSKFSYPAHGDKKLAEDAQKHIKKTDVGFNYDWGLDHGCWVVLSRFYPEARIPVIQLSLDYTKPPQWHYELAKELSFLRRKGVLIIGSGNIVHNLGLLNWKDNSPYPWAEEANETIKKLINDGDYSSLINYEKLGKSMNLAVPTPEHFLPLLYSFALKNAKDSLALFNDKTVMGSVSMTSLRIG